MSTQTPLYSLRRGLTRNCEIVPPSFIGGYFPRGQLSVVASKPGVGKTWFMLSQACILSNAKKKVCIMNGECGYRLLVYRMNLMDAVWDNDYLGVYCSSDFSDHGLAISLDTPAGWRNFQDVVRYEKPDIVFVDSLIAFFDGDESDMRSMKDALLRLRLLAERTDCAIVLNHHLRKGVVGKDVELTQDEIIGTSAITRIVACAWGLSASGGVVTGKCLKTWYKPMRPFYFRLVPSQDASNLLVVEYSTVASESDGQKRVMDVMRGSGGDLTAQDVSNITGLSYRYCAKMLQALKDNGLLGCSVGEKNLKRYYVVEETSSIPGMDE